MTLKVTLTMAVFITSIVGIPAANAIAVDKPELPCLACHEMKLGAHSQLGGGSYVCQVCHDGFLMKPHMLNGTLVTNVTVSNLCESCHHERYADWALGIHGTHGLNYTATSGIQSCITCHDPHIPDLPEISPLPPPQPPERSTAALAIWFPPAFALLAGAVFFTVGFTRKNGGK